MPPIELKVKKLYPDAKLPTYGSGGAGCFDLHAHNVDGIEGHSAYVAPRATFGTGLAFEIPPGHVMLVFSRSGHGFKNGVRLANCVGVIDSDYRGEVMVKLVQDDVHGGLFKVSPGDRVAQAMVLPVSPTFFRVVDELGDTARGTGGFGSTGAA